MTGRHLGDDIHDLLDGRCDPATVSRAMAHLDDCADCRTRWDDLRAAREALKTSSAGIDLRFAQQLLDRDRMAEIAKGESRHRARAARGRDRRPMLASVGVVAVVTVGMGAAYVAGTPAEVGLEFAEDAPGPVDAVAPTEGAVQFIGAQSMRSGEQLRAWVHPDWEDTGLVPIEAKVVRSRSGANVLVATVLASLDTIIITEQHGRLVDDLGERFASVDLGHTEAFIVGEWPQQLLWQTGEVVISATCSCPMSTLEEVAATFPAEEDPGFLDRVGAGLGKFGDVMTGQ